VQAGPDNGTATPGKAGRRILIVDDDPVFADLVGSMLALGAHDVQTASGGRQALDQLECGKFDLVMTDYNMPGMDGDELATAIKALNPAQPIALVTGEAEFLRSRGARLESVDVIINKPFTLEELRQAVARLLASLDAGGLRPLKELR
jgi:CheY-like chemotaxis protein